MPVSEAMSDDEVWQLIFAPGFSTAEAVTDVSGRGVGMDVVKRNIHEMGGHVEIASVQGKGTTIRIVLPLTLAILNGMSVKVGEEVYILPLNYVIESLQPMDKDVHSITADEHVMHVRGEYLALLELHKLFDVADAVQHAHAGHRRHRAGRGHALRAAGRPARGPAPGGGQEPGNQLPQGAGHFRRDDPGRRQRRAASSTWRPCSAATATRPPVAVALAAAARTEAPFPPGGRPRPASRRAARAFDS